MKKIGLLLGILVLAGTALAQTPQATFEKKGLKFDNVTEGTQLRVVYYFTNTGNAPLKIYSVDPSCGCTVATFPTYEIKPGQRDSINAVFDSNGRVGYNAKGVNLKSNAGDISLVFEAMVVNQDGEIPEEEIINNPINHGVSPEELIKD